MVDRDSENKAGEKNTQSAANVVPEEFDPLRQFAEMVQQPNVSANVSANASAKAEPTKVEPAKAEPDEVAAPAKKKVSINLSAPSREEPKPEPKLEPQVAPQVANSAAPVSPPVSRPVSPPLTPQNSGQNSEQGSDQGSKMSLESALEKEMAGILPSEAPNISQSSVSQSSVPQLSIPQERQAPQKPAPQQPTTQQPAPQEPQQRVLVRKKTAPTQQQQPQQPQQPAPTQAAQSAQSAVQAPPQPVKKAEAARPAEPPQPTKPKAAAPASVPVPEPARNPAPNPTVEQAAAKPSPASEINDIQFKIPESPKGQAAKGQAAPGAQAAPGSQGGQGPQIHASQVQASQVQASKKPAPANQKMMPELDGFKDIPLKSEHSKTPAPAVKNITPDVEVPPVKMPPPAPAAPLNELPAIATPPATPLENQQKESKVVGTADGGWFKNIPTKASQNDKAAANTKANAIKAAAAGEIGESDIDASIKAGLDNEFERLFADQLNMEEGSNKNNSALQNQSPIQESVEASAQVPLQTPSSSQMPAQAQIPLDDFNRQDEGQDAAVFASLPEPSKRGGLKLGGVIIGLALLGSLGALAWSYLGNSNRVAVEGESVAVIKADGEPTKIKPKDPGGKVIANQENEVYQQVDGENKPNTQEVLANNREEPVENVVTQGNDEGDFVKPRVVKTVVVKPDGTILTTEKPITEDVGTGSENGTLENATTGQQNSEFALATGENTETAIIGSDQPALDGNAPKPVLKPNAEENLQIASAQDLLVEDQTTENASGIKNPPLIKVKPAKPVETAQQAVLTPADTKIKPQVKPKPQPVANNGRVYVMQVAAEQSQAGAENTYNRLLRRYSTLLGDRGVDIRRVQLDKGTFYRIRIPVGTKQQAANLCAQYKSAGGQCFVTR